MANPRRRPIVPFVLFSLALAALGCSSDKGSIFAPSGAVLALRLLNPAITVNGSTTVIVSANQAGGAPVEDGTELAVTAATGTLHQAKLRTVSGKASVTYVAGPEVGLDQISASTGSAQALLSVRISSAVATSIQLSSRPDSLPTGGGTATITAVLTGAGGAPVAGGEVLFTTSSGTVNATSVVTDTEGKAAIAIETVEPAMIEAAIEGGPSAEYLLGVRGALIVRVTRRPAEPQVGDTVTFTVTPLQPGDTTPTGRVMVSFGDDKNFQQRTEGRATVTHVYRAAGTFSAEVEFVADNGDRARTTATVVVAPIPITYAVAVSASPAQPQTGDLVTFTVTATQSDGGRPSGQVTVAYGDGATAAAAGAKRKRRDRPELRDLAPSQRQRLGSDVDDHEHLAQRSADLHRPHQGRRLAGHRRRRHGGRGEPLGLRADRRPVVRRHLRMAPPGSDLQEH